MDEKKLQVRILPLKGIGGIGNSGDVVWLPESEAHYWVKEGYAELVVEDQPVPVPAQPRLDEGVEDHAIMKPQNKRTRK